MKTKIKHFIVELEEIMDEAPLYSERYEKAKEAKMILEELAQLLNN